MEVSALGGIIDTYEKELEENEKRDLGVDVRFGWKVISKKTPLPHGRGVCMNDL